MIKQVFFLLCFLCFAFLLRTSVDALACYQGQYKYGTNLTTPPSQCPTTAQSCILNIDWVEQMFIVACQTSNCSFGGASNTSNSISNSDICQNASRPLPTGVILNHPPLAQCCCYGDSCIVLRLSKMYTAIPPKQQIYYCLPRGEWGNWSDWSECPGQQSAEPIFEQFAEINMQTRFRNCVAQPTGCIRQTPFMCDGPHWEQRPCSRRPPGNGTGAAIFLPAGFSNVNLPNVTG